MTNPARRLLEVGRDQDGRVSPQEFLRRVGRRLGLVQLRHLGHRLDEFGEGLAEERAMHPGMLRRLARYEDIACRVAEARLREREHRHGA